MSGGGNENAVLITFVEFAGLEERMALSMKREAAGTVCDGVTDSHMLVGWAGAETHR